MVEKGNQAQEVIKGLGIPYETKKEAKEKVFDGIVATGKLMDEGKVQEAGEQLERTRKIAQELHERGQFPKPYLHSANIIMSIIEGSDNAQLERGILKERAMTIIAEELKQHKNSSGSIVEKVAEYGRLRGKVELLVQLRLIDNKEAEGLVSPI